MENSAGTQNNGETQQSTTPQEVEAPISAAQLPEELQHFIEELPEEQKKVAVRIFASVKSSFRGPLPPPEILKGYNDIISGGAERILTMAEEQSKHRMALESSTIREEQRQSGIGQIFGLVIGLICIGASCFLAYTGHDWVAGVVGGTTIISLVVAFVLGKIYQGKDSEEK